MATLPKNVSMLSEVEKFELLDELWKDLDAHSPGISEAQAEELDARVSAYELDRTAVLSWDQVKAGQPRL